MPETDLPKSTKKPSGSLSPVQPVKAVGLTAAREAFARLEHNIKLREKVREHTLKIIEEGGQPFEREVYTPKMVNGRLTSDPDKRRNISLDKELISIEEKKTIDAWTRATRIASQLRQSFNFTLTDEQGVISALFALNNDKEAAELIGRVYKFRYKSDLATDLKKQTGGLGEISARAFDGNIAALCAASVFSSLNSAFTNSEHVINLYRGLDSKQRQQLENELELVVKQTPYKSVNEFYLKCIPNHLKGRFEAVRKGEPELERALRFYAQVDRISFLGKGKNLLRKDKIEVTGQLDELSRLSPTDIKKTLEAGQSQNLAQRLREGKSIQAEVAVNKLLDGEAGSYLYERLQEELKKVRVKNDPGIFTFLSGLNSEAKSALVSEFRLRTGREPQEVLELSDLSEGHQRTIRAFLGKTPPSSAYKVYSALQRKASDHEIAEIVIDAISNHATNLLTSKFREIVGKNLSVVLKEQLKTPYYADLVESLAFSETMDSRESLAGGIDYKVEQLAILFQQTFDGLAQVNNRITRTLGDEIPASVARSKALYKFFLKGQIEDDTPFVTKMYQLAQLDLSLARAEREGIAQSLVDKAQTAVVVASLFFTDGASGPLLTRETAKGAVKLALFNAAVSAGIKSAVGSDWSAKKEGVNFGIEVVTNLAGITIFKSTNSLRADQYTKIARLELENEGRKATEQAIAHRIIRLKVNENPVINIAWSGVNGLGVGTSKGLAHAIQTFSDRGIDITQDPASFGALVLEEALIGAGFTTLLELKKALPKLKENFRNAEQKRSPVAGKSKLAKPASPTLEEEYPTGDQERRVGKQRNQRYKKPKEDVGDEKVTTKGGSETRVDERPPPEPEAPPVSASAPSIQAAPLAISEGPTTVAAPESKSKKGARRNPTPAVAQADPAPVVNVDTDPPQIQGFEYKDEFKHRFHKDSRPTLVKILKGETLVKREPEDLFEATPDGINRAMRLVLTANSPADLSEYNLRLKKLRQYGEGDYTYYSITPSGKGKHARIVFFWGEDGPEGIRISRHYGDH